MLILYIGFYTLCLAFVWGLFIVAKIHATKFKNFSNYIEKVVKTLFFFLLTLSILGYIIILFGVGNSTVSIDNYSNFDSIDVSY